MDIVINGDEKEKAEMAFKLIDANCDGYFNRNDLSVMIKGIVSAWSGISGVAISNLNFSELYIYKYIYE